MGWHVVTNNLPALSKRLPQQVGQAVAKVALDLEADAVQRAPIDTGNLRGSSYAEPVAPYTWRVGFSAEYALYQEMGTRYMRARPYMVPAWLAARFRLVQVIRRMVTL